MLRTLRRRFSADIYAYGHRVESSMRVTTLRDARFAEFMTKKELEVMGNGTGTFVYSKSTKAGMFIPINDVKVAKRKC